ncbi:MAG: histidine kinase [Myxococcales bacterium]|nr:histidine kinase [Myxococcales bacterium]
MPDSREQGPAGEIGGVTVTPGEAAVLSEVAARLRERVPDLGDRLARIFDALPEVAPVFVGEADGVAGGVAAWLSGLLRDASDPSYHERRVRLVRRHVRRAREQRSMFSALSRIRSELHRAAQEAGCSPADEVLAALDRACDVELSIMLDVYRERYVTQVKSAERLAAIGQIAASIGHDLRNPLAVIQTSAHMLARRTSGEPRLARHLTKITDQITLCTVIIADLLELARNRPPELHPTFLPELVREAANSVPRPAGVAVSFELAPDQPAAAVDAGQLRQLVVNLVLNAVQAVGTAGAVTVRLGARDGVHELTIEDDGPGLPSDAVERLFEPMFTTRSAGTGLGLMLCRRIVDSHHGKITAENREEGGARFRVVLPGARKVSRRTVDSGAVESAGIELAEEDAK